MKAMILAAGLGSRLKPWTDAHPKALAMVNGKSLLQRNIEYLQQHNIYDVVVNVHHFAEQIINEVNNNNGWGSKVVISDETDEVLETGGGLLKAAPLLQDANTFVLMNADILTTLNLSNIIETHKNNKAISTLAIAERESSRGLLFDNNLQLCGWQNNKTGEQKIPVDKQNLKAFAFSGIQVLSNNIFYKIPFAGKFSLIDVYLALCPTEVIIGYNHSQDNVLDVGKPESLSLAQTLFM
jgi:N-acetyl-alpha-D-muramate 1-phosphate uridylyltransferase